MTINGKEISPLTSGKEIEKMLEDWFSENQEAGQYFFHRLPDTHAAQGKASIDAQPSDFIITLRGGEHFYVEIKSLNEDFGLKFPTYKLIEKQYNTFLRSVELGFNYLVISYHRSHGCYLMIPGWLLRQEEVSQNQRTVDFEKLLDKYPWVKVDETELLIPTLVGLKEMRTSKMLFDEYKEIN